MIAEKKYFARLLKQNSMQLKFALHIKEGPSNNAQYALYAQYMPSCYISQDISGHI